MVVLAAYYLSLIGFPTMNTNRGIAPEQLYGTWKVEAYRDMSLELDYEKSTYSWEMTFYEEMTVLVRTSDKNGPTVPAPAFTWYLKRNHLVLVYGADDEDRVKILNIEDSRMEWGPYGECGAIKWVRIE
jgi:hypothetical protein